ncbi:SEC14-like protein 4 [Parasteatoda tepidariorum]|uniref:SEC14-like protein 4 n=1 Tax=Parasteatoda tepidariorum TaxID=114398 RepID=UPI001C727F88|nr:SEC14-like protein 4 [Parasteatoda tepidariorum]XP_015905821.2 SEC14-like protein 4 [Parasteatoda tepidariorum]
MDINGLVVNEKELIDKLRERVSDLDIGPEFHYDDTYYKKWLKARCFDLERAEEMLRKHIKFVRGNGLDKIEENFTPKEVTKYFHTAKLGYDRDGFVVRIFNLGASDLRGLVLSLPKIDLYRYITNLILSDIREQEQDYPERKSHLEQHVYILDFNGLSWSTIVDRGVVQHTYFILKKYEANYPENMKAVYIVNTPSFFNFIWSWSKSVLPETITSKVEILPSEDAPSIITRNIDSNILPVSIGGTKVDEDGNPECASMYLMPLNEPVPESLMLYQQLGVLENDPAATRIVVECGCASRIELMVKEPKTVIQWDFQTIDYDIRFGLSLKEDEAEESTEIITPHRVECHMYPETGTFKCLNAGLYELVFDNTYSWVTNKEIIYKTKIIPPSEISNN